MVLVVAFSVIVKTSLRFVVSSSTDPGMSNGGMFIWTRVMERLAGSVASAGTVCSAPLRGFDPAPDSPISIIDFHGRLDSTIPMSPEGPDNLGPGKELEYSPLSPLQISP